MGKAGHPSPVEVILTLHNAPGVEPPSHSLTSGLDHGVAADHSERSALLHRRTPDTKVTGAFTQSQSR